MESQYRKPLLAELAELYGVQAAYRDAWGRWRQSPRESLVRVLRALGAELDEGAAEAEGPRADRALQSAVERRRKQLGGRLLEPVLVAWEGRLHLPGQLFACAPGPLKLTLYLEQGGEEGKELPVRTAGEEAGRRRVVLWDKLPLGYHRLMVEGPHRAAEAVVISAPRRCWEPVEPGSGWGLFAPVYALPQLRGGLALGAEPDRAAGDFASLGAGDLADLEELCALVGKAGGEVVSTLPLLALLWEKPVDPSPYRPMSRLFWNELYLALDRTPEWRNCPHLRELWSLPAVQEEAKRLCLARQVDYEGAVALKRRLLLEAARCFLAEADAGRRRAFVAYLHEHPDVEGYAHFRARLEAREVVGGALGGASSLSSRELVNLHLYSQWQMEEQLRAISTHPGRAGLMLDLPVGVHPAGYDVQRWPELFAGEMSVGAPPDRFFTGGQDWAFPPLRPEAGRLEGHGYFAACLRHHMRHARCLRIDHIMSLHRLFWIPGGIEPEGGVYVTYPEDELYAVLCLESHRSRTRVVGEDLGTVPPGVRARLRRHGILGSWVLQGALHPRAAPPLRPPSRHVVAYLGTHDMFPWAGFWQGRDIEVRVQTGQLDEREAARAWAGRRRLAMRLKEYLAGWCGQVQAGELLPDLLRFLARTEAPLLIVGLDDLLLETEAQNVPGTGVEWSNWRRKARVSAKELKAAVEKLARVLDLRSKWRGEDRPR